MKQYEIELSDEAEADFDKSYDYYASKSKNIANNFYKQIDINLEKISENPFLYPLSQKDVRRYVMKKFPFVIYYQIKELTISVIAIFHTSRNPEIWKDRTYTNRPE